MVDNQDFLHQGYFGPVEARLFLARELYSAFGPCLLADGQVCAGLDLLQESTERLSLHMSDMGMAQICIQCAQRGSGGCCSLYMAGETDSIQLLMNMLATVDVRLVRDDGVECCYLGAKGCIFSFKPMFCLNYNCPRIINAKGKKGRIILDSLTGRCLRDQCHLEKMIIAKIHFLRRR